MPAPITLTQASYTVQGKPILHPLTLTLSEPRIGLIGRNGSGKTSLLRLIAGLAAPTAGSIRIGPTDPARDRKATLSQIGILFQNPDHQILFPTVEEELAFGLIQQGHPNPKQAVTQLLEQEGRSAWAKAPTHTLSQGQRQYLCLLSILAMQPAWLLLDEPFAALDLPTQTRLKRRLATLPQHQILISHDPTALAQCQRLLWLDEGHLRADGTPADILPAYTEAMETLAIQDADTQLP